MRFPLPAFVRERREQQRRELELVQMQPIRGHLAAVAGEIQAGAVMFPVHPLQFFIVSPQLHFLEKTPKWTSTRHNLLSTRDGGLRSSVSLRLYL